LALFTRVNELTREFAHKNPRIILKFANGIKQAVFAEKAAFLIARITYRGKNAEEVNPHCRFRMVELLTNTSKHIRLGEVGGNGWTESEQFLERLEQILKCIRL
jgi:hypothetical protein